MEKRFVSIWFRYLKADWYTRRHEHIANKPFVFYGSFHGSRIITAINKIAEEKEIFIGTSLADAKAIIPSLQSAEDEPLWFEQLLKKFTEWFIRYSPVVATDLPDGIIIDASGCTHLWGNEENTCRIL